MDRLLSELCGGGMKWSGDVVGVKNVISSSYLSFVYLALLCFALLERR